MNEATYKTNLGGSQPIQVSATVYRGEARLDIRHYYEANGGELRPTKRGVSLRLAEAQTLVDAINRAVAAAGED